MRLVAKAAVHLRDYRLVASGKQIAEPLLVLIIDASREVDGSDVCLEHSVLVDYTEIHERVASLLQLPKERFE